MDTIAALSSGSVPSGVAVIRVSGPRAKACVETLTGRQPPAAGSFELRHFRDGPEVLDQGLVLWFDAPRSFTGEDVAEFQTHGGRAVVDGVLDAIGRIEGVRFAEAGEFSKQAFLNGRLDLTEVEGLSDLIQAETSLQRRQAFAQLNGILATLYEDWRHRLIRALGHVEAEIDFADEDLPEDLASLVKPVVLALREEMSGHLAQARKGERLRDGFRVALYGAPNAGKSSLLNALAQRDVALVSTQPGTTRDVLEVHLNLGGIPVTVLDTAGLRESSDEVEQLGVARGRAHIENADLRVLVQDGSKPEAPSAATAGGLEPDLLVSSKADLRMQAVDQKSGWIFTSAKEGTGIDELCASIEAKLRGLVPSKNEAVPTRLRHRQSLERCVAALDRTGHITSDQPDLLAEELRAAMAALGEITGRASVEDMLDVVFRDFCIGK